MGAYPASLSPHLHSGKTVSAFHWKTIVALLPLFGISLWRAGLPGLGICTASLLAGMAAEAALEILLKKKIRLSDGSCVLSSLLFAVMIPPAVPFWLAALGAFFGIMMGREIFGGLGVHPFHPALVGRVFLEVSFPLFFSQQAQLFESGPFELTAVVAGAVFLFSQKIISWDTPVFYLAGLCLLSLFLGRSPAALLFSPAILFSAFFILTDPVPAPVSRSGRRLFAAAAGGAVLIFEKTGVSGPFAYALLMASLLSPWLDRFFRQGHSL